MANLIESRFMTEVSDQLLARIVETIVASALPERIILFGSRARGYAAPDSDVDLLVVESSPFSPQRSRRGETTKLLIALMPFSVPIDLLLYSHDEIEYWRDSINHVAARALREGRVLYDRS
jgi:uncharacterized protein